ncbi:MAG: hypothetical protein HUU14_00105 [Dehalococcoidia bacterium]|nr:hypothetical protein [Chloroflexi bacterium CFX7]MCL4231857.1 hypothetical protein [Dehalococcoidia bacterium]NUQ54269.1 hypothetical protein [Dehalococcoidia bacterium]RIL03417.1 MAG: hypothetical protein DCC78_04935 [bacterium]
MGAYALHAKHDSKEITRRARAAADARFYDQVDPDRVLDPSERERRAEFARKAHFARMALKSAQARSGKKCKTGGAK